MRADCCHRALSATGVIAVAGNSQVTFYDNLANSGVLNVVTGSTAVVFGALTGNGNSGGGDVQALGVLAPAASPGLMDFGGDLLLGPLATFEAEIGGIVPGNHFDQVNVEGIAEVSGTLEVQLIDGFMPTAGDTFEIITAASVVGTFDTINLPTLPADLFWYLNYGATTVELVSTYSADFNENGIVDNADLTAWEGGFGSAPAMHMDGDANANALAGGFDFLTWQRQLGSGGAAVAAVAAIPEPATWCMMLIGLAAVSTRNCPGKRS